MIDIPNGDDAYEKQMMKNIEETHQQFIKEYQTDFSGQQLDPRVHYEQEIHKLRERLHELEAEKNIQLKEELHELNLRLRHPAIQEAWEQYQIVIKLAKK